MPYRVLVVDAPGPSASSLAPELAQHGWSTVHVGPNRNMILSQLERRRPDAIVLDLRDATSPVEDMLAELAPADGDLLPTLDQLERRYIQRVLRLVRGNKSAAARTLGIDRRTLYRKLARFEERDVGQIAAAC